MFEIYSHRGGLDKPNTLKAFKTSIEIGVDGIECDVCLSKDAEPIIYHPGTPEFQPEPMDMVWTESKHKGVAHLDYVLNLLVICPPLKLLLDIKQDSKTLIEIIVERIAKANLLNNIFLTAPKRSIKMVGLNVSAEILKYARLINPNIKIHIIDTIPLNMAETVKNFDANMVSFGWLPDSIASKYLYKFIFESGFMGLSHEIRKAQSSGAHVLGGIANNEQEFIKLVAPKGIQTGINAVMTDYPLNAMAWRKNIEKLVKPSCL